MSLMQMQGVVSNVETRKVNTRNGEQMVYDIILTDGPKLTAWERKQAEDAWGTMGQSALFTVDMSQNGKYTNYTLKEVVLSNLPAGSAPIGQEVARQAMSMPEPFVTTTSSNSIVSPTSTPFAPAPSHSEESKDLMIWRQTATKVAAQLSQTEEEFWRNVDDLIRFYATGEKPGRDVAQVTQTHVPIPDDIPF